MKCLRRRRRGAVQEAHDNARIEDAWRKVHEIRDRGEAVVETLGSRMYRNHWGETVAAIARRES